MDFLKKNKHNLRVIKTARDIESINEAVAAGFKPLIKKVEPSPEIKNKYAIYKNRTTGKIKVVGDFRSFMNPEEEEVVIDWTYYYPYNFKSPFAAYLIPSDIIVGERVYLEDLIEDMVGSKWNQGNTYRLESCEAIWNGEDFEIQFNPKENTKTIIG